MQSGSPAPKPESTKHLRQLANGAVYDMNKKRIVSNPGGGTHAITSENAREYRELSIQKKRDALRRAANAVADQGGSVDGRVLEGDYAYIEAIGEAMTMKALSINDPKAVDAARFIFQETGMSEPKANVDQASAQQLATAALGVATAQTLAAVMRDVLHLHEQPMPIIDALVSERDISASNKLRIGEQDNTPSPMPPPTNEQPTKNKNE